MFCSPTTSGKIQNVPDISAIFFTSPLSLNRAYVVSFKSLPLLSNEPLLERWRNIDTPSSKSHTMTKENGGAISFLPISAYRLQLLVATVSV